MAAAVLRVESACFASLRFASLRFASPLQANAPPPAQPRRDTPVKVRAENNGVVINATPPGVRERIADDGVSPGTLHLARQQLHGHQKAAQKAVERAELKKHRSSMVALSGVDVPPGRVFKWNIWLKRKKLQWHSHRIGLRHNQEQRQIDLAKELQRNERTSCSEEACAEMTGEELMAKASYHSKMAFEKNRLSICPQGSFEIRPKGRFDFLSASTQHLFSVWRAQLRTRCVETSRESGTARRGWQGRWALWIY